MNVTTTLLVASLFIFAIAAAPTAVAAPDPPEPPENAVCVPGLTLCCYLYDDGGITPMAYCL